MTIFEALREDHDIQRALMKDVLETSGDTKKRRELFKLLKTSMEHHAIGEERCLYNPMIEYDKTQSHARHSIAEHHEMDEYIEELEKTDMSSSAWLTTYKKLAERLEHHLDEEEREIFPVAGKVFNDDKKAELAELYKAEMADRKKVA